MLVIKNLSKQFGDRLVLNNVDLTVKPGEVAVLVGPSGVGKSTLMRILCKLEKPNSGNVIINDKTLDFASSQPSHDVGMVFQNFNLFDHLSVERNVTLALEKVLNVPEEKSKAIADELLQKFGLLDKAHMPVGSLSGGQRQRLAIVRALAMKPKVLCLDEPTSALDPMLTGFVAQEIQDLAAAGLIVLVTTHDKSLVERLNASLYLMKAGRIVEHAPTQTIKQEPQNYPLLTAFLKGEE